MRQTVTARAWVKIAACLLPLKQLIQLRSCGVSPAQPLSHLTCLCCVLLLGVCWHPHAALEAGQPGTVLEFSDFKAVPLTDIIITAFHYYLTVLQGRLRKKSKNVLFFLIIFFFHRRKQGKSCKTFIYSLMKWEENTLLTSLVALYLALGSLQGDDKGLCVLSDLRISKAQ